MGYTDLPSGRGTTGTLREVTMEQAAATEVRLERSIEARSARTDC